jgi:hypothetical protein
MNAPEGRTGESPERGVIAAFEQAFPSRLRACYILGSHANASAIATSDLDLVVIFAGAFVSHDERDAALQLASACAEDAPIELDIEIEDEESLSQGVSPNLKLASAHIYGTDIRGQLPLISLEEWTRDRMHSSWWRIARLFARPPIITPPLEYPEPTQPFLGYTRRTVRLPDGRAVPSTRDIIRLTGWAATALLALERGVYVASKRDAHLLYHEHIGGPWDSLIADIYELCRARWVYLIPDSPDDRAHLRALCERTLLFERHFLARYNPYLIAELQSGDARAHEACDVMRRAPLADAAVLRELRRLERNGADDVRAAASAALIAYSSTEYPR